MSRLFFLLFCTTSLFQHLRTSVHCFGDAVVMLSTSTRRIPPWAVGVIGLLCLVTSHVSASSDTPDVAEAAPWQEAAPIAGFKLLHGEPMTLDKRQSTCAANGSNYCFDDKVNYCSTCGTCCGSSSSGYCCGSDQVCCGTACCASGQTCSDGKCFASLFVNESPTSP